MQLEFPFLRQPEPSPRVEFVRTRRARRYILRILPDGTLRVTVPRGGSLREARAFVLQNQKWIERERHRAGAEHAPVCWQHGFEILLRGQPVTIRVERVPGGAIVRYGERTIEAGPDGDVRAAIEADLRRLALEEVIPRLRALATAHGVAFGRVSIRSQRSRWGSCARNGSIALNFRLVQMPPAVRDYVIIHELMHIRQQNHSRRFWRLVEGACPAFRDAERWLRTSGRSLF